MRKDTMYKILKFMGFIAISVLIVCFIARSATRIELERFRAGMELEEKLTTDERFIQEVGNFESICELADIRIDVLNAQGMRDIKKADEKRRTLVYKVAKEYFGTKVATELKEEDTLEKVWRTMEYESKWNRKSKNK